MQERFVSGRAFLRAAPVERTARLQALVFEFRSSRRWDIFDFETAPHSQRSSGMQGSRVNQFSVGSTFSFGAGRFFPALVGAGGSGGFGGNVPALRISIPSCSLDRKSTRLNSSHLGKTYAVFCL